MFAFWIMLGLFLVVVAASYYGWGLTSDAQARTQARSVRQGSLHQRRYYGGGSSFGK